MSKFLIMTSSLFDYLKNFSVENLGSLPSKEVFPLCSWGSGAWAGAGRIVPQTLSLNTKLEKETSRKEGKHNLNANKDRTSAVLT